MNRQREVERNRRVPPDIFIAKLLTVNTLTHLVMLPDLVAWCGGINRKPTSYPMWDLTAGSFRLVSLADFVSSYNPLRACSQADVFLVSDFSLQSLGTGTKNAEQLLWVFQFTTSLEFGKRRIKVIASIGMYRHFPPLVLRTKNATMLYSELSLSKRYCKANTFLGRTWFVGWPCPNSTLFKADISQRRTAWVGRPEEWRQTVRSWQRKALVTFQFNGPGSIPQVR